MPIFRLRGGLTVVVLLGATLAGHTQSLGGDVNADGVVDLRDGLLVLRHVEGVGALGAEEQARADVWPLPGTGGRATGDGAVTAADAQQILRYVVGAATRGELTGQLEGPVILGFDPGAGSVGTQVVIGGVNFVAGSTTENQVTLAGVACPVVNATATALTITIPPEAQTGYFTVTSPGGSDSSDELFSLIATQIGQLMLPSRLRGRQSPADFVVESDVGSATPGATGGFDLPLTAAPFTTVTALPKAGGDQSLLAIFSPDASSSFQIGARSTAIAMLFLHPGVLPGSAFPQAQLPALIESLPQTSALAQAYENAFVTGGDPFADAQVLAAWKTALEALFAALAQQSPAPQQTTRSLQEDLSAGIPVLRKLDVRALNVVVRIRGDDAELQVANRRMTPVDWLTRTVLVDPQEFPNGVSDLESAEALRRYAALKTVNVGMVTASGLFSYVAFIDDVVLGLVEGGYNLFSSADLSFFGKPALRLDGSKGGVYLLRAYSGAFRPTDPTEFDSPLIGGSDSTAALLLNLTGIAVDTLSAVLGSFGSKELQAKVFRTVALTVAKKSAQSKLVAAQSPSSRQTAELAELAWEVVTTAFGAAAETTANEAPNLTSVKTKFKALVGSFNVLKKVATIGKIAERVSALVTGYPPSALLNVFGDAVGKVTPLETALVVVGDPWAPLILDHPTRVLPGAQFTITGRNFALTAADNRVVIGNDQVEVNAVNAEGTQLTVRAPDRRIFSGRLLVKNPKGNAISDKRVEVGRVPTLDSVIPTSGFAFVDPVPTEFAGFTGTDVTLTGSLFDPAGDRVFFGTVEAPIDPTRSTATKLVTRVPRGPEGQVDVVVQTKDDDKTNALPFLAFGTPEVVSAAPARGKTGSLVVVRGRNLGSAPEDVQVFFRRSAGGPEEQATVGTVSPTSLTATVTLTLTPGEPDTPVDVRVVTPRGQTVTKGVFLLEPGRLVGTTIRVNTVQDTNAQDDFLSLREAILLATTGATGHALSTAEENFVDRIVPNSVPGRLVNDTVVLQVGGTIALTSPLPEINGGFDNLGIGTLDATGLNAPPLVITSNGNSVGTFDIRGAKGAACVVWGNNNKLFPKVTDCGIGLQFIDASNNTVWGNIVGLGLEGNGIGVEIRGESTGNVLNGLRVAASKAGAEIPSGVGIWVHGDAQYNDLKSCTITGNASHGVMFSENAAYNTVTSGNVWANGGDGIRLEGAGVTGNFLNQPRIGVDKSGSAEDNGVSLRNQGNGVTLGGGAHGNFVGTETTFFGPFQVEVRPFPTLIANNGGHGVEVQGTNTNGNVIRNCLLGLPTAGNQKSGVAVTDSTGSPQQTQIEQNEIGGNAENGILVSAAAGGNASGATSIRGNLTGAFDVLHRMQFEAPPLNQTQLARNGAVGIAIATSGAGVVVRDNRLLSEAKGLEVVGGQDVTVRDTQAESTGGIGVHLHGGAKRVRLENCSITGSEGVGVQLESVTQIALVGLDVTGGKAAGIVLKTSSENSLTAGTDIAGGVDRGAIRNNLGDGIRLEAGSSRNLISQQLVDGNAGNGIALSGSLGNTWGNDIRNCTLSNNAADGVYVQAGVNTTTIGGVVSFGNSLYGNAGWGIHLAPGTRGRAAIPDPNVTVAGNFIGPDETSNQAPAPNGLGGVLVEDGWLNVQIGGRGLPTPIAGGLPTEGNVIAGNKGPGIQVAGSTTTGAGIHGNLIGVALNGETRLANQGAGIEAIDTQELRIGALNGNVISGNTGAGVRLRGLVSPVVSGNLIGTNLGGDRRVGNDGDGILLDGGEGARVADNRVVDNARGIVLTGASCRHNQVLTNTLGLGSGEQRLGQRGAGIAVLAGATQNVLQGNTVALSSNAFGVQLGGGTRNPVVAGSIFGNEAGGIGAAGPAPPTVTVIRTDAVAGETAAGTPDGSLVQVYADEGAQGRRFLGEASVRERVWLLRAPMPAGLNLTATLTDNNGNTSAFGGEGPSTIPPPLRQDAGGGPRPAGPAGPAMQPQQSLVFTSTRDGNAELYLQRVGDERDLRLTDNPAADHSPALSADAAKVAFVSERSGDPDLWVLDFVGTPPAQLTNDPAPDYDPVWSPDGTKIAFTSERDGNPEIYVADADGANPTRLTNAAGLDRHPAFSPDGTKIAFTSDRSGNLDVWVMNSDGAGVTAVTANPAADYDPAWSPDGATLAYVSERDGNPELYLSKAGADTRFTNTPAAEQEPAWSPDGQWLACAALTAGDAELFALTVTDDRVQRLTVSLGLNTWPAWSALPTVRARLARR